LRLRIGGILREAETDVRTSFRLSAWPGGHEIDPDNSPEEFDAAGNPGGPIIVPLSADEFQSRIISREFSVRQSRWPGVGQRQVTKKTLEEFES